MNTPQGNSGTAATVASAPPDAPYRGIESFRFIDQQIFAARAAEIWSLLSSSKLYRAVLLYGDSGTGKSSLINAGLLPRAAAEGYLPDRLRIQPFAGREIKVERIRTSSPAEQPVYLQSNFTALEADGSPTDGAAESFELSLTAFRKQLKQFRRPTDTNRGLTFGAMPRPLLIFDQFEEFITLFEEAQRGGPTEEAQRIQRQARRVQHRVLVTLIKLIRDDLFREALSPDAKLPVKLLFSFREDYLARMSVLFDHCPQLLNQALRLLPPQVEVLPEIIRAPFADPKLRAHFLRDEGQPHSELSEPLAREVAAQLAHHGAGDAVNLTELQIVCLRLWQSSDPTALFKSSGILGLLKSYGADVLRNFTPELRDAAVSLLAHMVTGSNTRNIVAEEDLLSRANVGNRFRPEQLHAALLELSRTQIVRRELRRQLYFYEITSEYLVPWIREQVAERKVIESRREAEEQRYQALIEESRQRRARMLQRSQRLTRLVAVLLPLLITAVGFAWYANNARKRAVQAQADATAAKQHTERVLDILRLLASRDQNDNLLGITKLETLANEKRISGDDVSVMIKTVLTSHDEKVVQKGSELLNRVALTNRDVALSLLQATETNEVYVRNLSTTDAHNLNSVSKSLPARLYIHISDESQRPQAEKMSKLLTDNRYIVPGIANVGSKSPKNNELRYFRKNDSGMPAPKDILPLLNQATGLHWEDSYTGGYEHSPTIRPGHFEIWFGAAPGSPNGWLRAWAADEKGNHISGLPFVITVATLSGEIVKSQRSGYLPLKTGDYILTADSAGYQHLRIPFSIKAGEEEKVALTFVKTKASIVEMRAR